MSHAIHAWLERGEPRLGIIDTDTGRIRQLWRLSRLEPEPAQQAPVTPVHNGTQHLARELFLIGCCEAIGRTLQHPEAAHCQSCRRHDHCHPALATGERQGEQV